MSRIDFAGLTHIAHYGVMPGPGGVLDPRLLKYATDYAPDLVKAAHEHGIKVLISVAQMNPDADFDSATSPAKLPQFIASIMAIVDSQKYDGVDLDWETNVNPAGFRSLVKGLRMRLNAYSPRKELTGSFWEATPYLKSVEDDFDQINVMAYDLCSPADGFSWFNAALFSGDPRRRSVESRIMQFAGGISKSKLGLGIPFYGYAWQAGRADRTRGLNGPGQSWATPPRFRPLDYRAIVTDPILWRDAYKHRDGAAGNVPYLSVPASSGAGQEFVTYDDKTSVSAKVAWARAQGLGGFMIWELSGDYLPDRQPAHPLMEAVASALRSYPRS